MRVTARVGGRLRVSLEMNGLLCCRCCSRCRCRRRCRFTFPLYSGRGPNSISLGIGRWTVLVHK